MNYIIREIRDTEIEILDEFLYEAIYIPAGNLPPSKKIINQPELQVYIADFGTKTGDIGLVAEVEMCIRDRILPQLSDEMQTIYRETKEGNGQRWLMIELHSNDCIYQDLSLIHI